MSQLEAFLLTLALEIAATFGIVALWGWVRGPRLWVAVVVASVLTHPILWAVAADLPPAWWWPVVLAMEVAIGLIEGVVVATLGAMGSRRGVTIGVAMNAFSFGVGLVIAPWWS